MLPSLLERLTPASAQTLSAVVAGLSEPQQGALGALVQTWLSTNKGISRRSLIIDYNLNDPDKEFNKFGIQLVVGNPEGMETVFKPSILAVLISDDGAPVFRDLMGFIDVAFRHLAADTSRSYVDGRIIAREAKLSPAQEDRLKNAFQTYWPGRSIFWLRGPNANEGWDLELSEHNAPLVKLDAATALAQAIDECVTFRDPLTHGWQFIEKEVPANSPLGTAAIAAANQSPPGQPSSTLAFATRHPFSRSEATEASESRKPGALAPGAGQSTGTGKRTSRRFATPRVPSPNVIGVQAGRSIESLPKSGVPLSTSTAPEPGHQHWTRVLLAGIVHVLPLGVILPLVIGAASVGPHEAVSNLSNWALYLGITLPPWLARPYYGAPFGYIAFTVLITAYLLVIWVFPIGRRRRFSLSSTLVSHGAPNISIVLGRAGHYLQSQNMNVYNVQKTVHVGVRNSGGIYLTNCKLFYEVRTDDASLPERVATTFDSFSLNPGEEKYIPLASYNEPISPHPVAEQAIRLCAPPSGTLWRPPTIPSSGGVVRLIAVSAESRSSELLCKLWVQDGKLQWDEA